MGVESLTLQISRPSNHGYMSVLADKLLSRSRPFVARTTVSILFDALFCYTRGLPNFHNCLGGGVLCVLFSSLMVSNGWRNL